jgi:hypothetical protein
MIFILTNSAQYHKKTTIFKEKSDFSASLQKSPAPDEQLLNKCDPQ